MENPVKTSALAAFPRRLALLGTSLAALAALHAGCTDLRDAADVWPEGAWIVARTEALEVLLSKLEELDGTPLARAAAARRQTLPSCPTVEAISQTGTIADAFEGLVCAVESGVLSPVHARLETADLLFSLPLGNDLGVALRGRGTIDSRGEIAIKLSLPQNAVKGPGSMLIPGRTPPGPVQLSRVDELVHARIRPEGALDIASLVSDGEQADQLFRLKSRLFAGAVLDGSWEAAIYLPEAGSRMPRAVVALGVSHRAPAVAAMEEFLTELQRTWPVHRSAFAVKEAKGACLLDLNILPEFAPCYVATENALVAGWNPTSLRHALDKRPAARAYNDSELVIELERFSRADALLADAERVSDRTASALTQAVQDAVQWVPAAAYPWRRVVAERIPGDEGVTIALTFESGA